MKTLQGELTPLNKQIVKSITEAPYIWRVGVAEGAAAANAVGMSLFRVVVVRSVGLHLRKYD